MHRLQGASWTLMTEYLHTSDDVELGFEIGIQL